jgi:myo-inositol-1(or 4)-monophosphatase
MNVETKNFILKVVKEIGEIQFKNFFSHNKLKTRVKTKYFNDIVTNIDELSEKIFLDKIKNFGFKGRILTEEHGEIKLGKEKQRLIIDSLDGSFNYSKRNPNFCIAVALEENNQIVFSVVYNPITKDLFFAEKQKGAFLNNKRIEVSKTKDLHRSTIILAAFPNYKIKTLERIFSQLMRSGGLRLLMHVINLSLCYIAAGRYDGLIGFYKTLPEWDKVPGFFILEQAGGIVTDFSGRKWNNDTTKFVASNQNLHKELLKIITK